MALITSSLYPEVRAAVDITLTSRQLPDSTIAMGIYQGLAEREVEILYPTAQDVITANTDATLVAGIQRATVFMTASLLVPAIPFILGEHFGTYQYRRKDMDLQKIADDLRSLAETEIDRLIYPNDITPSVPTLFASASGTRGS